MSHDRQSGVALVEVIIAVIVFMVLIGWAFTGSSGQLGHVAAALDQTQATRLAAGRLESLRPRDAGIAIGVTEFEMPAEATAGLPDARGEQRVRRLEPGLFEVQVTVSWRPQEVSRRRRVVLTTLIERGGDR